MLPRVPIRWVVIFCEEMIKGIGKGIGVGIGVEVWDKNFKGRFFPVTKSGVEQLSVPKIKIEDKKINGPK